MTVHETQEHNNRNNPRYTLDGAQALKMDITATFKYIGEAVPGNLTSASRWRIMRLTIADNTIVWADGNGDFDNIWDDHLILSYS